MKEVNGMQQDPPEPDWFEKEKEAHEQHGGDESPDRDCFICQGQTNDFIRFGETVTEPDAITYSRWYAEVYLGEAPH